ncbi:uncharacterized protein LOC114915046 [Cajanus cajan]|uniref:uncharacterized protein LOC114915046 n=1 Tax=Cajanus cajan TaxID=3821 RepID=UPI0010FBAA68|nr:uncharacterized protein LOC114915046 [Cajanus cajan]
METQIEEFQSARSLRIPRISSVGRESEIIENLQYTSLKDIICNTPPKCSILYEGNDLDSTIAIRNELVKRAASVYLQSTALLVTRNRNCFAAFWERLKNRANSYSRWGASAANPFISCIWPIYQFLNHMVGNIRSLP